ncbi:MAG: hypothetical protein H0M93_01060 [Methanophagales archaeon]|nr:hypothetical protein [Methanophagales archaeon]
MRESRFKPLEEKVCDKRFASMGIFNLSRESIVRYTLALFSPPLVTANGRVRSKANICAYLLDECFVGEKMTLERLFETIFELRGRVRVEGGQRNVFIERNPKQE